MKHLQLFCLVFCLLALLNSCKKELNNSSNNTTNPTAIGTTSTGNLAIGTVSSSAGTSTTTTKDTLFLVNCFTKHSNADSIAFSSLPAAIGTYLNTNYAGYTALKAFKVLDSTKAISAYIAVIKFNGNPVGLKFSSTGVFQSVLEQRAGKDLNGPGYHDGGPFQNRDGKGKDTIALSALPTAVKTYFTANYPKDTLLHALITPDTNYVLISENKGLFATTISAAGKLINRIQAPTPPVKPASVSQSALPAAITSYLTKTYPNYVFKMAYSISKSGSLTEYFVFITQNNTQYILGFDSSGNLLGVLPVH